MLGTVCASGASEPTLTIGVLDGPAEYQFHQIVGVLRVEDGQIVVADRGSSEIRWFDSTGRHLRTVGREGEGPGEYRNLALLGRCGTDSLLAWDLALQRGTILDRRGEVGHTYSTPGFSSVAFVGVRSAGDGSVISPFGSVSLVDFSPGIHRTTSRFLRLTSDGDTATIATLPGSESLLLLTEGRPSMTILPFAHRSVFAAAPWGFFYGSSDDYELRQYGLGGDLLRIIRTDRSPLALEDEQIDSYVNKGLEGITDPGRRRDRKELYDAMTFPETIPTYSDLLIGTDSTIWASEYTTSGKGAQRWFLFSGDSGSLVGTVRTPARFTVHEVGRDYVLGVSKDEWDVERVGLYHLEERRR